jgi:hypothetical protein
VVEAILLVNTKQLWYEWFKQRMGGCVSWCVSLRGVAFSFIASLSSFLVLLFVFFRVGSLCVETNVGIWLEYKLVSLRAKLCMLRIRSCSKMCASALAMSMMGVTNSFLVVRCV